MSLIIRKSERDLVGFTSLLAGDSSFRQLGLLCDEKTSCKFTKFYTIQTELPKMYTLNPVTAHSPSTQGQQLHYSSS